MSLYMKTKSQHYVVTLSVIVVSTVAGAEAVEDWAFEYDMLDANRVVGTAIREAAICFLRDEVLVVVVVESAARETFVLMLLSSLLAQLSKYGVE